MNQVYWHHWITLREYNDFERLFANLGDKLEKVGEIEISTFTKKRGIYAMDPVLFPFQSDFEEVPIFRCHLCENRHLFGFRSSSWTSARVGRSSSRIEVRNLFIQFRNRTHVLVAVGSTLFTLVGVYGFSSGPNRMMSSTFDPTRIASQIVDHQKSNFRYLESDS